MTLTLTATAQPSNDPPRILLEVAEDDPLMAVQNVTLYRDSVKLRFDPVISAQYAIAYDYDAPFDVPLIYRADADEINIAPEWVEVWTDVAAWTGSGWAAAAGVASSTTPGAYIYRATATPITQIDVVAPSNMTLELYDAALKRIGSVKVTPDGMVTVAGSGAAKSVTGSGDFTLTVADLFISVAGTGWETTATFAGVPMYVLLRAPGSVSYVAKYGTRGTEAGQLDGPRGIAFDSAGNFFVADSSRSRILKYNSAGVYQSEFGTSGTGSGQLDFPTGIAIDASDNIWVVDYGNDKVLKYNSSGVFQAQYGTFGNGNGEFHAPKDIAFDSSGNFFVTDTKNSRVQKFNSAGTYQSQFGSNGTGNGQFKTPSGIAIDASNNIFVAEWDGNRVQKFNSAGTYQSQFGSAGSTNGKFNNADFLSIDSSANIWVTDRSNNRIQEFTSAGVFVTSFGAYGTGDGQFSMPAGIKVRSSGDIFVVDAGISDRIQKFNQSVGSVDDITVLGSGLPTLVSATDTETLSPTGDQLGAWLTNAAQPELAIMAEASPVSSDGPYFILPSTHEDGEFEDNAVSLRIEGSGQVVTPALGPRLGERWNLDIGCTTNAARRSLESLLADMAAINLRFPSGAAFEELDGGFYAVGRLSRRRIGHPQLGPIHVLSLPLTPSQAPAYKPLWQWNMRTLAQTGMTMADVANTYPTMRDLLVGPVEV